MENELNTVSIPTLDVSVLAVPGQAWAGRRPDWDEDNGGGKGDARA